MAKLIPPCNVRSRAGLSWSLGRDLVVVGRVGRLHHERRRDDVLVDQVEELRIAEPLLELGQRRFARQEVVLLHEPAALHRGDALVDALHLLVGGAVRDEHPQIEALLLLVDRVLDVQIRGDERAEDEDGDHHGDGRGERDGRIVPDRPHGLLEEEARLHDSARA
ncbi:MAG: hypothetical protein R2878_11215 [Thermoleophilia bacterium]